MEQKRTGLSYVFTLARGERGKLGVGMLLAVLCSALSLIPYLVVYQILLLIIQNEVTFGAALELRQPSGKPSSCLLRVSAPMWRRSIPCTKSK